MNLESFRIIKIKLILAFVVGVSLVVGVALVYNHNFISFFDNSYKCLKLIKVAGNQRFLSQELAQATRLVAWGNPDIGKRIDSLVSAFEANYHLLIQENAKLDLPPAERFLIDSLFLQAGSCNLAIAQAIRKVSVNIGHKEKLMEAADILHQLLDQYLAQITRMYVIYESLEESAFAVNASGLKVTRYLAILSVLVSTGLVFWRTIGVINGYSTSFEKIRKQAGYYEKLMSFKRKKLDFFMDSIHAGVLERSKIGGGTEYWSGQLYNILGLKPGEVPGTFNELFRRVHQEDQQVVIDILENASNTGISSSAEVRVEGVHDAYKWIGMTCNVMKNEKGEVELTMIGVEDVDDRKRLESQLKVFVEHAPAAIAMFNKNMEYLVVSTKWVNLFDLRGKIVIGQSHYELVPTRDDLWDEIVEDCFESGKVRKEEIPFITDDKELRWMKWEVRPWYITNDEFGGVVVYSEDITEEKHRNQELRVAKEEAVAAARSKEQFLATMSHEIRTPLNAINGLTYFLLSENPRSDQVEHLNLLKFSGENLLSLINDILDIAKIEAGKLQLDYNHFDFCYLINNIRRSLAQRAEERMVNIEVRYDERLPRIFIGDVTRITQILYNLVGNAIKFTEVGTVSIYVDLTNESGDEYDLKISVADTGIGISFESQDKIFRSFEQAENGTTRKYGGTGLGLYVTKMLLHLMGSEIYLESSLGEGSTFYFCLKLKKGSQEGVNLQELYFKEPNLTNRNIGVLVVEDNTANQTVMGKLLRKAGVDYDIAEDGSVALEYIESKKYDMVFMDLQMPVMDGYTATARIRANKDLYFKQIPIVALSADAFVDIKEKALSLGMTDYMSKPFKPLELYSKIDKYSGKVKKNEIKRSQLEELIDDYSEKDLTFKREFTRDCINNYLEFKENFEKCLKNSDYNLLRRIVHKIQTLNSLLKLTDFQDSLKVLVKEEVFTDKAKMIICLQKECDDIIDQLNKIKV